MLALRIVLPLPLASCVTDTMLHALLAWCERNPLSESDQPMPFFVLTCSRYDAFSSILGEGKPFVGIANSYLQSGHTVLLVLVLLCGFVELPGFPLTSLPYDVREFLKVCVCSSLDFIFPELLLL